jgi:hypothetical protein
MAIKEIVMNDAELDNQLRVKLVIRLLPLFMRSFSRICVRLLAVVSILMLAAFAISEGEANAQCPPVGADVGCGAVITVTKTAASIFPTGQPPYDQVEDSLVGVINNSNQPIRAMQLRSAVPIFAFDLDGLCGTNITPQPAGCPFGPTTYEGPGVSFSNISPDQTTGTVNFNPPIPTGGGMAYFSLEEDIRNVCSCSDVLNHSVPSPTLGGPVSLNGGNTSIGLNFTPQCGGTGGNPPTLAAAAFYCGFTEFDWQQTFTSDPPPETTCAAGSTTPLTAPPPYNDPPLVGWSYQRPPNAVMFPIYYNLFTAASDPLSLAHNELPTNDPATSTMLSFFDAPGDICLPGLQSAATAASADALCGAPCGSTITGAHNRAPAGSVMAITTHLVGIVGALPGVAVQDTGIGFNWTSTFNGTTGGISVKNSSQPVDPGSGSGGITITGFKDTTNYQYNGLVVTTVNGSPVGGDTIAPVITVSASPSRLWPPNGKIVPVTIFGTITDNESGGTGVNASTAGYAVKDEYGKVQPSGVLTLDANGNYSTLISLEASRNGTDLDGRHYTVTVTAQDNAGNLGSSTTGVIVPHDQRQH